LSRAAEKKQQFLEQLHFKPLHVKLDHNYASKDSNTNVNLDVPILDDQHLANELYTNHVCISHAGIVDLELQTRA